MNRWMGVSLVLAGVVVGMLLAGGQARLARADDAAPAATQTCEWSYVKDTIAPEIGEAGKIAMDEEWRAMSAGGWRLVAVEGNAIWVFERCR